MYSEYTPLNKYEVLKRVTQEEIYQIVVGYLPIANKYVVSPLREDKLAGAFYEWVKGYLLFKDFADPIRRVRDCFQMLMDYFKLSYNESLELVDEHFKLGIRIGYPISIRHEFIDYSSKTYKYNPLSKREGKNNSIYTKARPFLIYDKHYWENRFGITKANLIEDNVFPLLWFKFFSPKNNDWLTIRPMDICYSFDEFQNNQRKIYRPLNKNNKFLTNLSQNHIGNIDNIPITGEKLIITKAYKDCRIIRNCGIRNIVWFQSENQIPEDNYLLPLCKRFNKIVVLYDNDEAGIVGGVKLVIRINEQYPDKAKEMYVSHGFNDTANLYENKGKSEVMKFLKTIY